MMGYYWSVWRHDGRLNPPPIPVRGTLFALQWVYEMTQATCSALRRAFPC